jgi:hypothetical protein
MIRASVQSKLAAGFNRRGMTVAGREVIRKYDLTFATPLFNQNNLEISRIAHNFAAVCSVRRTAFLFIIMGTVFIYHTICLLAGITAVFRPTGSLWESPAHIRVPDGDGNVSLQLHEKDKHAVKNLFRPTARNGVRRRFPNRKAGATANNDFRI